MRLLLLKHTLRKKASTIYRDFILSRPTGYHNVPPLTYKRKYLRCFLLFHLLRRTSGSYPRVQVLDIEKPGPEGPSLSMARPTGFEPAISSVTGRRDRPTSLRAHNSLEFYQKQAKNANKPIWLDNTLNDLHLRDGYFTIKYRVNHDKKKYIIYNKLSSDVQYPATFSASTGSVWWR